MRIALGLLFGAIFGVGIALSGMINPAKVLNFFDIAGRCDPSLAFVMAGGLAVALPGYAWIFRARKTPLLSRQFHLPKARIIDGRLLGGAALFGIGWGIAGFCPGGAIPALGLLDLDTMIFLVAMVGGMLIARGVDRLRSGRPAKA